MSSRGTPELLIASPTSFSEASHQRDSQLTVISLTVLVDQSAVEMFISGLERVENGVANFSRLGLPCAYMKSQWQPYSEICCYSPNPMEGMNAPVFNLNWSGTGMAK